MKEWRAGHRYDLFFQPGVLMEPVKDNDVMLKKFRAFYENLHLASLDALPDVYAEDIRFVDPVDEHQGITALHDYFANLLDNCHDCRFAIHMAQLKDNGGFVTWTMTFSHPKIKSGQPICVDGCSEVRFDANRKIQFQQDYYDMGAMLYEHLPLLGSALKWIKRRLKQ
ncbi:nuclear transport factor 2 family protein [Lacimicrobium sp. SS2-24]|uniref:nuclear transport factor 2 family protein n=1 Tax=Lacimicrobium sp. SS2-24 TaxID=2005569 RepID=UPI000B4AF651|nr:nuclear transport factor 2 family protein [Lacimicrobium sp. SS2-24]